MALVQERRLHWPRRELQQINSWTGCPPVWLRPGWYAVVILWNNVADNKGDLAAADLTMTYGGVVSVLELHLKLEISLTLDKCLPPTTVMIGAKFPPWPDSHHSNNFHQVQEALCAPHWFGLESPPLWRNSSSSGGFTIDPHFLWDDIPSSTHARIQSRFYPQGVQCRYSENIIAEQMGCKGKSLSESCHCARERQPRAKETLKFGFCLLWLMSLYLALPFSVLYDQALYYFNAFPVMSSWGHA